MSGCNCARGWLTAAALWAFIAAVGGCRGAPKNGETELRDAKGARDTVVIGGREGETAPDFTLLSLAGKEVTLSSLRGKVVLVDFWDTWCGPCLRAMPHLKALSLEHPDRLVVVAVALGQEGEAKVREVVSRHELPFPVVLLGQHMELLESFGGVDGLPTTFLLDADGVVRRRWVGAQSPQTYENAVRTLIGS